MLLSSQVLYADERVTVLVPIVKDRIGIRFGAADFLGKLDQFRHGIGLERTGAVPGPTWRGLRRGSHGPQRQRGRCGGGGNEATGHVC
jgi:hypothetical protein